MNDFFNKDIKQISVGLWTDYSWRAYQDGNYEEALKANSKAQTVFDNGGFLSYDLEYQEQSFIEKQRELILNRTWKNYP